MPNGTYTGQMNPIDGNPDNTPSYLGTSGVGGTAKDEVDIDWAGIRAGTHTASRLSLPGLAHGGPVQRLAGDSGQWRRRLPSDGKGILIVTGNMTSAAASAGTGWCW